jgi:DnaK suppressor protein
VGSVDDFASYPRPAQAQQGREDARGVVSSRKAAPKRVRRASLALALSRLEREHVALLLAICELETSNSADPQAEVLRAALLPMLREDLRQTQQALGRAARGLYGTCEECHKPITARQLELVPAATRCAACQGRERRANRALKD